MYPTGVPPGRWRLPAAVLAAGLLACNPGKPGVQPEVKQGGKRAMSSPAPPVRLEPEHRQERPLQEGETHPYLVRLEAGEFVRIVAEQRGVDLVLRLLAPSGERIAEVDSPTGTRGAERVSEVAAVAGDYRVEVEGEKGSPPGSYEIRIDKHRDATEADRKRVEGERVFLEGEGLRQGKKFAEAIAQYERAVTLGQEAGDLQIQAAALYSIGWMRESLDERQKAAELCLQAADLYRQAGDSTGQAQALNRSGRLLGRLGHSAEAKPPLEEAVRLFRANADPAGEAAALSNLSNVQIFEGRFLDAVETSDQILTIWRRLGDRRGEVTALLNLGRLYLDHGKWNEARGGFESALQVADANGFRDLSAAALNSLGILDYREGSFAGSREHGERALALYRELGDRLGQAIALNSLGTVLLKAGDAKGAQARYEEAQALFHSLGDAQGEAMATSHLGRVALALGDTPGALSRQRTALAAFERLDDRSGLSLTHFGIAQSLLRLEKPEDALQEIEKSLELAESQRTETESLDLRASYFATRQHYWELKIDILLALDRLHPQQGYAARALETEERRRARSLLDALAEVRAEVRRSADPALLREEGEVRQLLAHARKTEETSDLAARLERIQGQIRKSSPRLASLEEAGSLSVAEIQERLLDTDTLLLIYSLGEERSVLWKVTRSTLAADPLPRRKQIETTAGLAYDVLSLRLRRGAGVRQKAVDDLASLILAPAAKDLPRYKRLLIVADGALQRIPFGALPDPGAAPIAGRQPLLIEGHPIINLPSASVGATLRQERPTGSPRQRSGPLVAVLADPVFDAADPRVHGKAPALSREVDEAQRALDRATRDLSINRLERLLFSREEADAIQKLGKSGDVLTVLDFAANRQVLGDETWRHVPILHFATHGLLDDRQPELSGLVFSQVNPDGTPRKDGFLRLHEIYGLDLHTDLVVLSACQTGGGKELRGEGLLGLTRGFLSIGVPQLVVSLWKVGDRATKELMARFYGELFNGYSPPEALQRAQKSMLQESAWSDPALWAGFIFVGDYGRKPGGGIEVRDTGGTDPYGKADTGGLPPPKIRPPKPKPPKGEGGSPR
jgi:CHAT domain-containing protein